MRKLTPWSVVLPFVAILVAPLSAAAQDADHEAAVDELMAAYNRSDTPGAVIGVVKGGELIFSKAYGMASLEHGTRLTTESVLDIGSVSKQFTSFAIALLADRGNLGLDDDIRTHLPDVPDFGSTITVRHLVHHMSGLREIYNSTALAGRQDGDGVAQMHAQHLLRGMKELNFEPGDQYLYCNTGYMLLADIVATASGMSFPDFMEANVFGPLGMHSTTIMEARGQVIPGAAESYGPADVGFRRIFDNSGIQGAGGVYSTVGDLAKWVRNFATAEVGGPAVMEQMKQQGVLNDGEVLTYAFGLRISDMLGQPMISHGGSSAGYRASLAYFPEIDAAVIRQANRSDFAGRIDAQIGMAFFGEHFDPMPEETPPPTPTPRNDAPERWTPSADELSAFEGRYFSPELETMYTLVVEDGKLIAKHRRHADFELRPTEQDRVAASNFFGTARFERDVSGAVTGMRVSNGRVLNLWFEKLGG